AAALDPEAFEFAREEVRYWSQSEIFARVILEDAGVRDTILDDFTSFEVASASAELADLLGTHLDSLLQQLLLRVHDLAPRLTLSLHAAVRNLSEARTSEQLAQVAVSCRRTLERLANAVCPPADQPRKGRKVGAAQTKNRLWAYVEEHTSGPQAAAQSLVQELGGRIDHVLAT